MGFGFRKSKNFGGVRLNLSKSGLGVSYGVKGFRISTNSKGSTLYAGRNGFYYRKKIGKKSNPKSSYRNSNTYNNDNYLSYLHDLKEVDGNFNYYIHKKEEWNLKELSQYNNESNGCAFALFFVIGLFYHPALLVTVLIFIIFAWKKEQSKIKILPESKLHDYTKQINALSNKTIMHNAVTYQELQYGICQTKDICNSYLPYINLVNCKLLFSEKGIIFYNSYGIFKLPYKELQINITETTSQMINPPSNSQIICSTFEHVNKDGTPNKKYKNNKKVDKIKTWVIELHSNEDVSIPLAFFNNELAYEYYHLLEEIIKLEKL